MRRSILRTRSAPFLAFVLSLLAVAPALAQEFVYADPDDERVRSRLTPSLALLNTQALGELATGPGIGVGLAIAGALDPAHALRARLEFRGALYGSETDHGCLQVGGVGCVGDVDVQTTYGSVYFGLGPELVLPVGSSALVLAATGGLAGFSVSTSVQSSFSDEVLASTNDHDDWFFAWSLGGELRIPAWSTGSVMLGAHYQHNGEASYVPEGGVIRDPNGTLTVRSRTTEANQAIIMLGVAFRPFQNWHTTPGEPGEKE